MKIRSAFIAICLSFMLALAPIAIKQLASVQSLRWRLLHLEAQLTPDPRLPATSQTGTVAPAPSGQSPTVLSTTVVSTTGDLLIASPTLPTTPGSLIIDMSSAPNLTDTQASQPPIQVSIHTLSDTVPSLQPVIEVIDSAPTPTPTAMPLPTATNTPANTPTPLPNRVDLQISQSAQPDPVQAGALLTYTIQIDNPGPGLAQNVLIRNTLPTGLVFEGAASLSVRWGEEPALLLDHNQLTGSVSLLKVGGKITILAPVRVRPNLTLATLLNQVSVTSTTPDDQQANNQAITTVTLTSSVSALNNSYLPAIYK